MRQLILCFMLLLFIPAVAGAQTPMRLPVDGKALVVRDGDKDVASFDVEITCTQEQRERGLMFRQDFPANRAMLFRFPQMQLVAMWMANTPLPLDMLFLNEKGMVVSIFEGAEPFSKAIISSQKPAAFVIELNAGQVKKHNIAIGQQVSHPALDSACGE